MGCDRPSLEDSLNRRIVKHVSDEISPLMRPHKYGGTSYVITYYRPNHGTSKEQWARLKPARDRVRELADKGCVDICLYRLVSRLVKLP